MSDIEIINQNQKNFIYLFEHLLQSLIKGV